MKYETDPMEIMANYLNHKGYNIEETTHDGFPAWEINDLPVDDPMDMRSEYDREFASFMDNWEDGEDITKRDGFDKFFVKGRIHRNARDGCARYDALFRDTILSVSVQPDKCPTLWLIAPTSDCTTFRVRRATIGEGVFGRMTLYLRVTGGMWEYVD